MQRLAIALWMTMVACGGAPTAATDPTGEGAAPAAASGASAGAEAGALDALTCGELDRHLEAVETYVAAFEAGDPMDPQQGARLAQLGMAASQSALAIGGMKGLSPACQAKAIAMQGKFQAVGERAAAAADKKVAEIEAKLGPELKKIEGMQACMAACEGKPPEAMGACMQACVP